MITTGLIFARENTDIARKFREDLPFSAAWTGFENLANDPLDTVLMPVYDALRWRLLDDVLAAQRAAAALQGFINRPYDDPQDRPVFAQAQMLACLHGGPSLSAADWDASAAQWFAAVELQITTYNDLPPVERLWTMLHTLCAGVLLNRPDLLEIGSEQFRRTIDIVQPHGFIRAIVEGRDGGSLFRTIEGVQALVLAAEVAANAGLDLWGYEQRGVSVTTAALYPLYFYFYPEKWPWESSITLDPGKSARRSRREKTPAPTAEVIEDTKSLFRTHASFLEIVNHHTSGSVRAVTLILDELRPIIDLAGGGPVTLTHALAPKRRSFFWR